MMPVDSNGVRAEMIMDPTSIPGRMNPSNLYEQYFSGISRRIKTVVTNEVNVLGGLASLSDESVTKIFSIVLDGLSIFDTEQLVAYKKASIDQQRDIITEIVNRECYIYYKVSSKRRPYQVVEAAQGTIFNPIGATFIVPSDDQTETRWSNDEVIIAPQYVILLAKTPEHYLATASAKTNHYDMPISVGPRVRQNLPYRNSPVKVVSETETRLYSAYVGRKGLAELKDRANSTETHRIVYENILRAKKPSNIPILVDRKLHPFGTDKSIELSEAILNVSGIDIRHVPGRK